MCCFFLLIYITGHALATWSILFLILFLQVRLCREKKSGNIYAMKKLKKSEMLMRGQVTCKLPFLIDTSELWRVELLSTIYFYVTSWFKAYANTLYILTSLDFKTNSKFVVYYIRLSHDCVSLFYSPLIFSWCLLLCCYLTFL